MEQLTIGGERHPGLATGMDALGLFLRGLTYCAFSEELLSEVRKHRL